LTKFAKRKLALISLILILVEIVLVTVLPPLMNLDPYSSTVFNAPPGTEGHLLGTDERGPRPVCRLVYGRPRIADGRAGFHPHLHRHRAAAGPFRRVLRRRGGQRADAYRDVFQAFPSMILIMVIVSITGRPSRWWSW
jgi:peptide/nickel transport system permease protein